MGMSELPCETPSTRFTRGRIEGNVGTGVVAERSITCVGGVVLEESTPE